jgi:hypothetical protein
MAQSVLQLVNWKMENINLRARLEILTTVTVKSTALWDVTLYFGRWLPTASSSTLKMEAADPSTASVSICQITWRHIAEAHDLHMPLPPESKTLYFVWCLTGAQVMEFCPHGTKVECTKVHSAEPCKKLHFKKIIQKHTDESLGDCSFLNTCFHMDTCKYVRLCIHIWCNRN